MGKRTRRAHRSRPPARLKVPEAMINLWGSADLLYAFYQGNQVGLEPGQLGAAYFIVTVLVPLLLITHGLVFWLLLQRDGLPASLDSQRISRSA
jgi:hypothetical protein